MFKTEIRHATPEEIATEKTRRWWKKHDRDVWELKRGDYLIHKKYRSITKEVESDNRDTVVITNPNDIVFDKKDLARDFMILCFVEDRKDLGV